MTEAPALARTRSLVGPLGRPKQLSASIWLVEADGRRLVVKEDPGALDEADGLASLAAMPGAPPVPSVVAAEPGLLIEEFIEPGHRSAPSEEALGRSLAHLHAASWPRFGGGSSWVGRCQVDPHPSGAVDAVAFYGARLTELARRCGLEPAVQPVVARLGELLPPGGPSLVHGDLWWGNVLWGADGRAWVIDPSAHGGHGEEDLAMLALFGPVPARLLAAYQEVTPLAPGWQERVALWQLLPLLVHAVLFDGGYRAQALAVAERYR